VDHCDVSSDRDHDKDYYDGLIDVSSILAIEILSRPDILTDI
jgi:hypothetical protein